MSAWLWRGCALGLLLLLLCGYMAVGLVALAGTAAEATLGWIEQSVEAVLARCK